MRGDSLMNRGTLTKGRKKKTIILDYKSWLIILEPNFPAHNYILTKKNNSHSFKPAYCGTLESALNMLFEQLMIANIEKNDGYGKKFADLRDVLIETKKEFKEMISLDVKKLICEEGGVSL